MGSTLDPATDNRGAARGAAAAAAPMSVVAASLLGMTTTIDCGTCVVRGLNCDDCMVTALLGPRSTSLTLEDDERQTLEVLASSGLVPPLRLVQPVDSPWTETA